MIKKKRKAVVFIVLALLLIGVIVYRQFRPEPLPVSPEDRLGVHLMPLPAEMKLKKGKLLLPVRFEVTMKECDRNKELEEMIRRFTGRMDLLVPAATEGMPTVPFRIFCEGCDKEPLCSSACERYDLVVRHNGVTLRAGGYAGVIYGMETLLQLVERRGDEAFLPAVVIHDRPRYPWRGVMIDVARHWIPKSVILRNLDAMAAVKMNVLHLHLTDYQAVRVESKVFPLLQERGSRGHYFSQEDIREIIRYAGVRGIRVIPEFDLPGHCTSWFAGYPELATVPGPYVPDSLFGVSYPVMDPTREEVYRFLDRFFGEMASLFPDSYIHIGGDEVNPKQWQTSRHVQLFMETHGLEDVHALQAYFNSRLDSILLRQGKKMMGWDEILDPGLPEDIVVQVWRNQKSLFEAVRKGRMAILSAGYYLDHQLPAGKHYSVDPEVLPGAVDIEPDTLHWKTWDITMNMAGNSLEGALTLYGQPGDFRGVLSMMGGLIAFPEAAMEEGVLAFDLNTDYGKFAFRLRTEGDSVTGKGSLGIISIKVRGRLVGGDALPGTMPPVIEPMKPLTEEERTRILGGEACMWSEMVDSLTIESRIWPRTAAIAEKLWSPASLTNDTEDMYRRLAATDSLLTLFGLQHHANYLRQLQSLAGGDDIADLKSFIDLLEEVKYYDRMAIYDPLTIRTPLNRVVDAAWPESAEARRFNRLMEHYLEHPEESVLYDQIISQLQHWSTLYRRLEPVAASSERVAEVMPLARLLAEMSSAGMEVMKTTGDDAGKEKGFLRLDSLSIVASHPVAGVLLAVDPAFMQLARKGKR